MADLAEVIPLVFPPDSTGETVTEAWVARQFATEYKDILAFCHTRGGWYEFDGSIWRYQETPAAFHYTRLLAERMSITAKNRSSMQKAAFCKAVETFARADPIFAATAAAWDRDIWLLGTPDGTVDLRTGELRKSKRTDKITKSVAVAPDYFEDCPIWTRFLDEATASDQGLIRFLRQICGYALTGDISEQMLFFIHGTGGNGKGTFMRALQGIMASYSVVAPTEALEKQKFNTHSTDLAMLQGARLVTASETDEGSQWNEKRIKALTGGDPITARFMHKDNTTFVPQLTLLIVGNHQPALRSVDEAMLRRFNMIPFNIKPKRKDLHLDDKIQLEWPGVLRWMINGCLDWQANGFVIPDIVREATETYFEDQNLLAEWLDGSCEVDLKNEHLTEKSVSLFRSWSKFAIANGSEPGNSRTFKAALKRFDIKHKKFNDGAYFMNVRLKSSISTDDDYDDPFR